MDINSSSPANIQLPIGMKFVIGYFLAVSLIELIWPIFTSHTAEFDAKSNAYKIGHYFGQAIFQLPFIAAGIGLALRKRWAEYLGFALLAITTITFIPGFYLGLTVSMLESKSINLPYYSRTSIAILASVLWHGLWAFLLYRNRAHRDSFNHGAGA